MSSFDRYRGAAFAIAVAINTGFCILIGFLASVIGIGGIGAAALGVLADARGIVWVYQLTAFLPLLGLATALLPRTGRH